MNRPLQAGQARGNFSPDLCDNRRNGERSVYVCEDERAAVKTRESRHTLLSL